MAWLVPILLAVIAGVAWVARRWGEARADGDAANALVRIARDARAIDDEVAGLDEPELERRLRGDPPR